MLNPRPAYFPMVPLGAAVATLLEVSIFHIAPLVGLPVVDVPLMVGNWFTADFGAALWVGYILFFLVDILIAPLPVLIWWPTFPSPPETFRGAALRGLIWGVIYGIIQFPFGFRFGVGGAVVVLVAAILWGIAFSLIAMMARGISPIDTLGWAGYDMAMGQHDIGRSLETHAPGR
jgi:hypothetical protein